VSHSLPPKQIQQTSPHLRHSKIEGLKQIFGAPDIKALRESPKGRYAVVEFLANYFSRLGVKEKIDNNELNIIADFHFYNLGFAKDQLCFQMKKLRPAQYFGYAYCVSRL
jgi:hypothetical protein